MGDSYAREGGPTAETESLACAGARAAELPPAAHVLAGRAEFLNRFPPAFAQAFWRILQRLLCSRRHTVLPAPAQLARPRVPGGLLGQAGGAG